MDRTIITNARVFDGEAVLPSGTEVVVEGRTIAEVTVAAARGSDDHVIDAHGATVLPGMTSGHFHTTYHDVGATQQPFGLEKPPAYAAYQALHNARLALAAGFTNLVGASCAFDVDASLAAAVRDGLVVGPRLCPASRDLIATADSNDVVPWWWQASGMGVVRVCDGPEEFRKATRDEIKRGAKVIKVYVTGGHGVTTPKHTVSLAPDELRAVVDAAHGRNVRVRAHVATKQGILDCIAAGVDILDHADGFDDECIAAAVEAGTFVLPSLYLPLKILELSGDSPGGSAMGFTTETGEDFGAMCAILGRAAAAGVRLCVGDDFGAVFTPHGSYAKELAVYTEHAGIDPIEVLRWATVNGAALFGEPDRLGRIEVGRLADLVVVDGDPTSDIACLDGGVRSVMLDGRFVDLGSPVGGAPGRG
jgi:imidazolonepropionase-like amidohydrolase